MEASPSLNFDQLSQSYIGKVKNAFQMIDADGDGKITVNDLSETYQSIGKQPSTKELEQMLYSKQTGAGRKEMSFPEFLSLISSLVSDLPDQEELAECFRVISQDGQPLGVQELIRLLQDAGYSDAEQEFAKIIKVFSSTQQSTGSVVFKGSNFVEAITD